MSNIFGYFEMAGQIEPAFDPGPEVLCPYCTKQLGKPLKTISLMRPGSGKSYFYRAHKDCYEKADPEEIQHIESTKMDAE